MRVLKFLGVAAAAAVLANAPALANPKNALDRRPQWRSAGELAAEAQRERMPRPA